MLNSELKCDCFSKFKNQNIDFIKGFKHWILYLHFNQYFVGRTLLICRRHIFNIENLNSSELLEMKKIILLWKSGVIAISEPINYTILLSNTEKSIHRGHLHVHLIPRHARPIIINRILIHAETKKRLTLPYYRPKRHTSSSPIRLRRAIKSIILGSL